MSYTLYTIEFDQDDTLYYYVGITRNYNKRMERHVNGSGATWIKRNFTEDTRRNAESQVIGKFTQNAKWEETKKTLELMVEHGINNVQKINGRRSGLHGRTSSNPNPIFRKIDWKSRMIVWLRRGEELSMLEFSEFYKFHECYILTRHGKVLCVNILINQILEPNVSKLE